MAFTKITNTELNSRGATTLPNQPTISAAALKQEFDAPAKEIVAPHFNGLIDELEADTAGASIGLQAPARRTGSTVKAVVDAISNDLVTVEGKLNGVTNAGLLDAISLKHGHENKALLDTYDQTNEDIEDAVNQKHSHSNKSVIDKWSESEGGAPLYNGQPMTGDMYSSEYDPDSTVKNAGGIKTYVTTVLGTKVDKVDGKGLSTNDYSNTDKNKVDTLGTSAYKNSTSVVTESTDLVESGAVFNVVKGSVGWVASRNIAPITLDLLKSINTGGTWNGNAYTLNGITYTVNEDLSVSMSGTSTGASSFNLLPQIPIAYLDVDNYYLTGCPEGGDASTKYAIYFAPRPSGTQLTETGNGLLINNTTANQGYNIYFFIRTGVDMTGKVLKVQLEKGTSATPYYPYHASVSDILDDKADNSVIGTVEGANASKTWSAGEHFIKDGQFKEVTNPIARGEAINSGNTTDKPIADIVTIKKISVTPSTGFTFNTANAVKIFDKLIMINIVIDSISLSTGSATQIGYVETSAKPSKEIYTTGVSNNSTPIRITINTNGSIFVVPQTAITSGKVGFSLIYEI
jgi:hypothetical protein